MEARKRKKVDSSLHGLVCVIDGDQGIRNSLYMLLGTLRIRAATFSTAEEFLERLNGERPAFLITEIALPGMTGFELKEDLNRKGIRIPAIGLTGDMGMVDQKEAKRLGFIEIVEKPFVYSRVVHRVEDALGIAP